MKKNTRINVLFNAKRDTVRVVENYKRLFSSEDRILFYTHEKESSLKDIFKNKLGITDDEYSKRFFYSKYDEYDAKSMGDGFDKTVIVLRLPSSLFYNMSLAYNDALKFVDSTSAARFVHFFSDDFRFIADAKYDPTEYEEYMDKFSEPFIMDGKTNMQNYAFKKMSPRFVFVASALKSPVSFFQYEGHDHFVIDRDNCKLDFDKNVMRMHIIEYILHCHKKGYIHNLTFYTDPSLNAVLERDDSFPQTVLSDKERQQIAKDGKYLGETLKYSFASENSVDPIIERLSKVLDSHGTNEGGSDGKTPAQA